ncbi:MAG: DinB family protein [Saprospiraceae bacterium]|nr:DinB family protein [Saprospiraceae bacterium]MCB0675671.1 DinB family protein [Saprospiraceae bacterium]MCB0684814.1 DinB family protein [Saprospiraceae bacterium]
MSDLRQILFHRQWEQLQSRIAGLEESFLTTRHRPEKWSIHENLAHLGRYQEIFLQRATEILTGASPGFGRYRAEDDPLFETWRALSVEEVLSAIELRRERMLQLLSPITAEQWKRKGQHPKLGWMDLSEWLDFFLLHESHHLYTIFWLVMEFR